MKPGKNDIPVKIKISGRRLEELQKHTWHMCEAFGLDRKVENYKGVRPISFYSWDLDCILDVLDIVLNDDKEYPDKKDEGFIKLHELYLELKKASKKIYRD
ncbi:conserved hypothetical protein [Candidatus Desulfarcum epimagneticum]|uniref:Uncharacterized protein n=1 Tax=uncultured Desulfobacteraceae bacterium TaxID=218296 RepID=A0A484HID8_9BACT|nr:conserved hypothetical protein [uncultured Desulfobacteraceae bacterium]